MITVMAVLAMVVSTAGWGWAGVSNDYVKISRYKGIEIQKVAETEVTDDEVQEQIDSVLSSHAVQTEITDRAAQSGDWVNIDFSGMIDGVAFSGGTASGQDLQLGSSSMIPGFEDAIIGHNSGEQFEFDLAFPDPYTPDTTKSGVTAHWTVIINSIYTKQDAELTDDFVKNEINLDGVTTVDEYKATIRESLEKSAAATATQTKQKEVFTVLLANTTVLQYPQDKIDAQCQSYRDMYQQYATMYGIDYDTFLQEQLGMTEDQFEEKIQEVSKTAVEEQLIVEAIADKEKLTVDDAYYNANRDTFATDHGFTGADEMEQSYDLDTLQSAMEEGRVLTFLVDHAREVDQVTDTDSSNAFATNLYDTLYGMNPTLAKNFSVGSVIIWCIAMMVIAAIAVIAMWILFLKAGERGWAAIIPFYNLYVLYKITWGNGWFFLLTFIPVAGAVIGIITMVKLAKAFGKGTGFAVGLVLLSFIFILILAFGSAEYTGPVRKAARAEADASEETAEIPADEAETEEASSEENVHEDAPADAPADEEEPSETK